MSRDAMTAAAALLPGWYGKIPALGDFASRRLAPAFVNFWDGWLQQGLAASRASLQERWLAAYLNGPLWNFVLMPGVCSDAAWAGAMMPSVDKVGRHFPLTIALELEPRPELLAALLYARSWFAEIGQVALDCLRVDCDLDVFEARLAATAFPVMPEGRASDSAGRMDRWWNASPGNSLALELPAGDGICALLHETGLAGLGRSGRGKSLWWSEAAAGGAVRLLAFPGMPGQYDFASLLDKVM